MSLPLTLLWVLFGRLWMAVGWPIAALIVLITIIGIPFAWAHRELAGISLWPVGKDVAGA